MLRDVGQPAEQRVDAGITTAESDEPERGKAEPPARSRQKRHLNKYAMLPELPPLPSPWESSIEFPDGSIVDVVMKPYRPDPPPLSGWSKLIHVFDALAEEAASGDAAAARVLYRSLKNCEEAFTDRVSYEKALDTLHKEGVQIYPSGEVTPKMLAGSLEMKHAEEDLTESFERCEGITADHHENKVQWAEIAAYAGDYWAMTEMAYLNGYTPQGLYWYEQAWLHGYAGAADSLSVYYREGAADSENGQPDYFRSYAYLYVGYKIYADALSRSTSPQAMNRIVSMENVVRQHGSFLSPEQQAQAESLAARLLEENGNCCLGGWQAIAR